MNSLLAEPDRYLWDPDDIDWDELTKAASHGHHIAGTPYTYHHGWVKVNPGDCGDGCGVKTKGGKYLPGHDTKHIGHLHDAVTDGQMSKEAALGILHSSPKLQDKLNTKLAKSGHDPVPPSVAAGHPDYQAHASNTFKPELPPDHPLAPVKAGQCLDGCGGTTKGGKYLPGHDGKHVKKLSEAVQAGTISTDDAHEALSHSTALQAKLASKLGNAPAAPAKPAAKPAIDLAGIPGQNLHGFGSTTPDGRKWQNTMVAGGRGSHYQIEEKPGTGPDDPFRNQRMRMVYLGDGTVVVQRNPSKDDPDTWVDSTHTTLDALAAPHRSKVWQQAAKQLRQAEKNEKVAKAAGAFAPKPPSEPKPAAKMPPKPKPAKQDLASGSGTTAKGRSWLSDMKEGGVGSTVDFGTLPNGTDFYSGKHWRAEYIGNNQVRVSYLNESGQWDAYTTTTMLKLAKHMPGDYGYGAGDMGSVAHEQMKRARKNELATNKAEAAEALASGGHAWLPVVQTGAYQAKVATMFNDDSGGAPHMTDYAAAASKAKAKSAHRVAGRMTSPTDQIVKASGAQEKYNMITDYNMGKLSGPAGTELMVSLDHSGDITTDWHPKGKPPLKGWAPAGSSETDRMVREAAASRLINRWAVTSNDSDVRSLSIQEAAIHEFGLTGTAAPPAMKHDDPQVLALKPLEPVFRDFLRAQYELTQADFKKHGITHVTLYRGMGWHYGSAGMPEWAAAVPSDGVEHPINIPPFRPLSSWSRSAATAKGFGGQIVLTATVPVESIMGYPQAGLGCLNEGEFVVLGNGAGKVKAKRNS